MTYEVAQHGATYDICQRAESRSWQLEQDQRQLKALDLWDAPRWSSAWPTSEGLYWFYGQPHFDDLSGTHLIMVSYTVFSDGSGSVVEYGDYTLHNDPGKPWGAVGVWMPVDVPELPQEV